MNVWSITFKASTNIPPKDVKADRVKYESGIIMFFTMDEGQSKLVYLCNTDQLIEIKLIS
jgi:hypothetical protein